MRDVITGNYKTLRRQSVALAQVNESLEARASTVHGGGEAKHFRHKGWLALRRNE